MAASSDAARVLESPASFEAMLVGLTETSNDTRSAAEALFERCKALPEALIAQTVRCLRTSGRSDMRDLSAVLLRKLLSGESSLWPSLPPSTQAGVKTELINSLKEEENSRTLRKVGDAICELASSLHSGQGEWAELLPFMFAAVQGAATPERLRESSLLIFARLAQAIVESLVAHLPMLHNVLQQCLAAQTLPVRLAAMQATVALTCALENPAQRRGMEDLVPAMLALLGDLLNSGDEEGAQEALELLVELAGLEARFLRKHAVSLAQAMLSIASAATLDAATRQLSLEFLVTLCEAAGSPVRKLPELADSILKTTLSFLLDVEEDPAWDVAEEESDFDAGQGDLYSCGMESLDRLSCALGGKILMPLAGRLLPSYLAQPDWKCRHAGLQALSQIAEGCTLVMARDAANIATMIAALFRDPHPRVRWAAINALGQLCTDLAPDMQRGAHSIVCPALVSVLSLGEHTRVQAHATAAIVNFAEECPPAILAGYMDSIISALLQLLRGNVRLVQEGTLTAIASVADAAAAQFSSHYDSVMPMLVAVLSGCVDKSQRVLRAKALECATLVGLAVGPARFAAQASVVVGIMVALEQERGGAGGGGAGGEEESADDPMPNYLLQAWTRVCKCMGPAFLPYLPLVMPRLLASAGLKPDVVVQDAANPELDEDEGLEHIQLGDKVLSIRTSVLEEKAMACQMLCCYVEELGEGMLGYLEEVGSLVVPLFKFYLSEEVRTSAVAMAPLLVRAARAATASGAKDASWYARLLEGVWEPLLEALRSEPDMEVVSAFLYALSETVGHAGASLSQPAVGALVAELQKQLAESEERRRESAVANAAEELDEEERCSAEGAEESVVDAVHECLNALLKQFHAPLLPLLQPLMGHIMRLLASPSPGLRKVAIFTFDDVVEHASEGADPSALLPYFDAFFADVLRGCSDADADSRQAAAYGVGVAAQRCPQFFAGPTRTYARDAVAALCAGLQAADARHSSVVHATDNVVSALGKTFDKHRVALLGEAGGATPAAAVAVISLWLSFLPLRGDVEEAQMSHDQLLRHLEASDKLVLGDAGERLPAVLDVFRLCVAEEATGIVSASTCEQMRAHLQSRGM